MNHRGQQVPGPIVFTQEHDDGRRVQRRERFHQQLMFFTTRILYRDDCPVQTLTERDE